MGYIRDTNPFLDDNPTKVWLLIFEGDYGYERRTYKIRKNAEKQAAKGRNAKLYEIDCSYTRVAIGETDGAKL